MISEIRTLYSTDMELSIFQFFFIVSLSELTRGYRYVTGNSFSKSLNTESFTLNSFILSRIV